MQSVIALGFFDGVHLGHGDLLARAASVAAEHGWRSAALTFDRSPGKDGRLLTTVDDRIRLIRDLYGVEEIIVLPFTEEFSRLSSQEYVRDYLVERIGVHTFVVGYNHHFGHNKDGDFRFLQSMQAEYGFEVYEISRQQIDDEKVSSTVVRQLITAGDVAHAMRLLERPYILITNLKERAIDPYKLLPPNGRYRVEIEGQGAAVLMISHSGMNLDFASSYNLEKPLQIGFIDRIG